MSKAKTSAFRKQRPEFMVLLGLAPPYSEEDVDAAYRIQAKRVHPDHGGSTEQFHALQEAFDRAKQYVAFRSNRRQWVAGQMEGYLKVRRVIEQLEQYGAEVTSNAIDWLEQSFGDFAQLTETINGVRLVNSVEAEAMIQTMLAHRSALAEMTRLELPGCQLTDEAVLQLESFQQLRHLDLTGTTVTKESLWIVDTILGLDSLELKGTQVGWWMRLKVRSVLRQRREAKPVTPFN